MDSAYNTNVLAHFGCTKFIVRLTDMNKCLKEEKKRDSGFRLRAFPVPNTQFRSYLNT